MIPPGETIGILGGGQLGRMLAMAAAQLGYRVHIYAPEADSVAAEVSAAFCCAPWDNAAAMAAFAADCAVITYEFENVPIAPLAALGTAHLLPNRRSLQTAQDRVSEKQFIETLDGRPAPYAEVRHGLDLKNAITRIGTPGILKTRFEGYDGKGQIRISSDNERDMFDFRGRGKVYEGLVGFDAEFSVLLCRGSDGDIRYWDTPQNVHHGGILASSTVPASAQVQSQVHEARALAAKVAQALDYVGVLTLEFFATPDGPVFNEMAPRVHNSGHWTVEGALTSQFENHIRAICGLPLGDTALAADAVEMRNLIGDAAGDWARLLADPANHLHLYGKCEARPGRKMGHVTRLSFGPAAQ